MKDQKMEENIRLKYNKEKLTEQLERRHKERQTQLDNLQQLKNKEASESEAVDYFDNVFDTKLQEIENEINNLIPSDKIALGISFQKINNNILNLQKYLSNSTIFLSDYKIKTCQNEINDLTTKSDEMKTKLIPKKKFGFRSQNNKVPLPDSLLIKNGKLDNKLIDKEMKNETLLQQKQQQFEWTIANKMNESFLLEGISIDSRDITLSNLNRCIVQIIGHPGSLQLSNLNNCIILCGPVARSIFADNCKNCKFAFSCQQLRLHSSKLCDIYLHVTCRAIIEDCNGIIVAPYNFYYSKQTIDYLKSGLDREKNNWTDIADFNWLSPDKQSPNWRKMNENEIINDWNIILEIFKKDINSVQI